MKKQDLQEIKNQSIEELMGMAKKLKKEIADLQVDKHLNKLSDVKVISKKKKEVAQLLTIVRQKQLLEELKNMKGATE